MNVVREWVATYSGSNPIRGYRAWFGVSEVCAITELRMIGVAIPESRLEMAQRNEQARAARRARRRQTGPEPDEWADGFASGPGYSSGAAPYGIEQDVADAAWEQALDWSRMMEETGAIDDDLPF
jgi:hypothetical protein